MSEVNDVPFMIVCEEAHNYVPRSGSVDYAASKKSIERIVKEGRKYGISLMVVSQRPSEVSDTIFAQCNNFIALEKPNPEPQSKNVDVYDVWKEDWKEIDKNEPITLNDVLKRWRK
jgi:hypothetical protein